MVSFTPGVWLGLGDVEVARLMASSGFGWLGIDQQHGRFDDSTTLRLLDRLPPDSPPAYVRVRSNDFGLIGRALDSGADGVIVPMISTAEQARAAVDAGRYAPDGSRSFGPLRGYDSLADVIGAQPLIAAMIESADAVDAAAAIAAVPGIGMLFIGPFDLSITLGRDLDEMLADRSPASPLERIAAAADAAGIPCAAFAGTPERAALLAEFGISAIAITTDSAVVAEGARALLHRGGGAPA
jgi:4-hydroxy-2-oxoheptanedioate aldolase